MDYKKLLQRLYGLSMHGGVKLGLENMHKLNQLCGKPDQHYRIVHVAGTNGKGSVSTKIAKGLELAGHRVGLFTSPHLSSFRERIQINSRLINRESIYRILLELFAISESHNIAPTFFEITTMAALLYFAEQKVDYCVLEVGLGGRLDATNIVNPILSVITSISLDHTEILGTTLEAIASEKAGIIKPQIPVVIGPRVPFKPILERCTALQNSLFLVASPKETNFEKENQAVAFEALQVLNIPEENIFTALHALPPCRLEHVQKPQFETIWPEKVILDVGHNPDGLEQLFHAIKQSYPDKPITVVCGLSANKDIEGCLKILKDNALFIYLTQANNERAAPAEELKTKLINLGMNASFLEAHPSIPSCVRKALASATINETTLVICGTFFIMAEVRKELGIQDEQDDLPIFESFAKLCCIHHDRDL